MSGEASGRAFDVAFRHIAGPDVCDGTSVVGERRHRIIRIIRVRCGDALTDDDLALIAQPAAPPAEMLPDEIGAQIMDVLEAMEMKLDQLVEANSERGRR